LRRDCEFKVRLTTQSRQTLLKACQDAKDEPSRAEKALIAIPGIVPNTSFQWVVTRTDFEIACEDQFAKSTIPVRRVLKSAKHWPCDADDEFLVGESTEIPKVRELLL
jgi:molecular chaperone DnaK (HSP70)